MKRLTWKNPTKERTLMADHRRYMSKCGRYALVHSHIFYGAGPNGMPDRWYAMTIGRHTVNGVSIANGKDRIIGDFGSQRNAIHACIEHAEEHGEPIQAKRRK